MIEVNRTTPVREQGRERQIELDIFTQIRVSELERQQYLTTLQHHRLHFKRLHSRGSTVVGEIQRRVQCTCSVNSTVPLSQSFLMHFQYSLQTQELKMLLVTPSNVPVCESLGQFRVQTATQTSVYSTDSQLYGGMDQCLPLHTSICILINPFFSSERNVALRFFQKTHFLIDILALARSDQCSVIQLVLKFSGSLRYQLLNLLKRG